MDEHISVRQWQEKFQTGTFENDEEAGWSEIFFPEDDSRVQTLARLVMKVTDPFILDHYYVEFLEGVLSSVSSYIQVCFTPLDEDFKKRFLVYLDNPFMRVKWTFVALRYDDRSPEFECGNIRKMAQYINRIGPELAQGMTPSFRAEKHAVSVYISVYGEPRCLRIYREGEHRFSYTSIYDGQKHLLMTSASLKDVPSIFDAERICGLYVCPMENNVNALPCSLKKPDKSSKRTEAKEMSVKNPVNIYKDELTSAQLFGKEVLFTAGTVLRYEIPEGWYCYDLCGSDRKPDKPQNLVESDALFRIGSVLSPIPLIRDDRPGKVKVRNRFFTDGRTLTLAAFCQEQDLPLPQDTRKYIPRPASSEEAGLFYALPPETDKELGAIGHVRIDFGFENLVLHTSWFPRGPEELNSPEFKAELQEVVDELRNSVLRSLATMRNYCYWHGGAIQGGACCQNYGYVVETERYLYRLRCNPTPGDYQAYLSCFDKQAQTMGLTEKGRQDLKDAADPGKGHTYSWYVIEQINDPDLRKGLSGSLEEAVRAYSTFNHADKRLGVTKDSIAAVDLVICLNGREWLSDDWQKLDSFKDDPMVSAAVSMLRQKLEVRPLVGRVNFANGERIGYTSPKEYLSVIKEELPYHAASGFRYETLTDDPEVRKAVDDILYDLYGEENPRPLEDYGGMTMGGMS